MDNGLKVIATGVLIVLVLISWSQNRPDAVLSTLDQRFSIDGSVTDVVDELERLQLDYTVYAYSEDRYRVVSGTPALSPRAFLPTIPEDWLDACSEFRCSVQRISSIGICISGYSTMMRSFMFCRQTTTGHSIGNETGQVVAE